MLVDDPEVLGSLAKGQQQPRSATKVSRADPFPFGKVVDGVFKGRRVDLVAVAELVGGAS